MSDSDSWGEDMKAEFKRLAKKMAYEHGTAKQGGDDIARWVTNEIAFAEDGEYPLVAGPWKEQRRKYGCGGATTTGWEISDAVYEEYMRQLKRIEAFLRINDW